MLNEVCEKSQRIRQRSQFAFRKFMIDTLSKHIEAVQSPEKMDLEKFINGLNIIWEKLQAFMQQLLFKSGSPDRQIEFGTN